MKYFKSTILILISVLHISGLFAQEANNATPKVTYFGAEEEKPYQPIDFNLQIKNMHLWRGLEVTPTALSAIDLAFTDKSEHFRIGVWGGAGFTGEFKEFDYYISYSIAGFQIALWDIYNFSPDAPYNNDQIFNYEAHRTGHFIDLSVGYRFQGSFPLNLNWATIIFGRDRGEFNEKNLYSNYVSADYPVLRGNVVDLDLGIAGAFAFRTQDGSDINNFYSKHAGIVNINAIASKKVVLGSYVLPVSVMAMWNPANNYGNIQVALDIF